MHQLLPDALIVHAALGQKHVQDAIQARLKDLERSPSRPRSTRLQASLLLNDGRRYSLRSQALSIGATILSPLRRSLKFRLAMEMRFSSVKPWSLLSFATVAARSQNLAACLSYGPSVVEVTGTLVQKTFTDGTDRPETYWVLELSRPICVNQDPKEPDLNYAQKDVRLIQLVFLDQRMFVTNKDLLGKKAIAKGSLFAGISAHHHLPVLLTVGTLRIAG